MLSGLNRRTTPLIYIQCCTLLKLRLMKRYLAFYGNVYYPSGGMDDFIGDYDTEQDALNAITEKLNTDKDYYDTEKERWEYSWAHIYDTKTRKEVWCK